nr:putative lipid II flippase FtsW [bacterium]
MPADPKAVQRMAQAKEKRHAPDTFLLILTLCLVGFGILMVYDASYYSAMVKFGDRMYFFNKQIFGAAMGIVGMIGCSLVDYHFLEKMRMPAMLLSIALLVLVLIPGIGQESYGARRWLNVGISIQPSEISKFAMVIYLSSLLTRRRDQLQYFTKGVLPALFWMGIVAGLICLQPNLSSVVCIALLTFAMLFVSGCRVRHLVYLALCGVVALAVLIILEPYRMKRMMAFLNPWENPTNEGYQLIQSLYALGNGGLGGMGLGYSRQKFQYLPFSESDFIFSIVGEEFGFIGAVLLLAVYGLFIWRGVRIAYAARDQYGTLMAMGITITIAIQVIINVAVVTGSMPPTGLPLPFISAGGSSLAIFMSGVGVLLNISRSMRTVD